MKIPESGERSQEKVISDGWRAYASGVLDVLLSYDDKRRTVRDVPLPSNIGDWLNNFHELKENVGDALPGSPNGLNKYVNALWAQFISEEYPTPISEVPIPKDLAQWAEDSSLYLKGLGPRLLMPLAYYLTQSFVAKMYLFDGLESDISFNTAVTALILTHSANLGLEYSIFKSGGVPVNALGPILRQIMNKMPAEVEMFNKPLMATGVILSYSMFSEIIASGSVAVGSELYKLLITANALLLLGEGSINTVLLGKALARVFGKNVTDYRETLSSFDNMQFGL